MALTNVGDTVSLKFIKVGDGQYIITNSFENLSLENKSTDNANSEEQTETTETTVPTEEGTADTN